MADEQKPKPKFTPEQLEILKLAAQAKKIIAAAKEAGEKPALTPEQLAAMKQAAEIQKANAPAAPAAAAAAPKEEAAPAPEPVKAPEWLAPVVESVAGATYTGQDATGWNMLELPNEQVVSTCQRLKDELGLTLLVCLSGTEYPDRFGTVLHLQNLKENRDLCVKYFSAGKADPVEVPSVAAVWPTADWHERESFDLLGIRYTGHPDMRRILLPADAEAHPLRRDYVAADDGSLKI